MTDVVWRPVISRRHLRLIIALLLPLPVLRTLLAAGCLLMPFAAAAAQSAQMDMHHMDMNHADPAVQARPVVLGDLVISSVWARATVPSVAVGAAYFTIQNRGMQPDTLVGASCPVAGAAMLHRTVQKNGVSHMEPAGNIDIPPGKTLQIAPGGLHLMLMALKQPLHAGVLIPLTLEFRHAGKVDVQMQVVPLAAQTPGG
jgi:periplasmic copper chaperone A